MASTGETLTSQEYIAHHLHHLQVGSGFWTVNIDSMVFPWSWGRCLSGYSAE